MSAEREHAKLYANAKSSAEYLAGGARAFVIVGPTFRKALVAQCILQVLFQQGETVPAETVRVALDALYTLMSDDETLI